MEKELKYKVIKTEGQYNNYCDKLEKLLFSENQVSEDEIELLTLLIETWDEDHYNIMEIDPIMLLKSLMKDHDIRAKELGEILSLSKGTISKMLNYQTGLSKETIRRLSERFKLGQEAFNRPYKLKSEINRRVKNASMMNTRKAIKEMA